MQLKRIIPGFKNSQRFRVIFHKASPDYDARQGASEYDIGFYLTIRQLAEDFVTTGARVAVWDALEQLARMRDHAKRDGDLVPTGLGMTTRGFQIQISLD
jgi:hypothetical protein